MIIFAFEGVLADDDHRKHLIYPNYSHGFEDLYHTKLFYEQIRPGVSHSWYEWIHKFNGTIWRPDYEAYYDACDEDEPILSTIRTFNSFWWDYSHETSIQIWSGQSWNFEKKTRDWIRNFLEIDFPFPHIKFRAPKDMRPLWEIKKEWVNDHIGNGGKPIEMVFESDPESIAMFRRKGIFVFDCRQEM